MCSRAPNKEIHCHLKQWISSNFNAFCHSFIAPLGERVFSNKKRNWSTKHWSNHACITICTIPAWRNCLRISFLGIDGTGHENAVQNKEMALLQIRVEIVHTSGQKEALERSLLVCAEWWNYVWCLLLKLIFFICKLQNKLKMLPTTLFVKLRTWFKFVCQGKRRRIV